MTEKRDNLELTQEEAAELIRDGFVAAWRETAPAPGNRLLVIDPTDPAKGPMRAEVREATAEKRGGLLGWLVSIGLV